jgi:hypothetical protein
MDQLMWMVIFIALSLAVGMSVVAVRLLGGDRRRRVARVAALEAAAFEGAASEVEGVETDADDLADFDAPAIDDFRDADRARFAAADGAMFAVTDGPMFAASDEPKAPSRRWLALAAVGVVMAGLMGTAYALFKPASLGASPASLGAPPAASATPPSVNPVAGAPVPPIELLSLKHTVAGSTFTVTGLVQDPIDGAPLDHVIAVVYLFDNDGAYVATGRADLEFRGLRPGEEAPFVVKIPDTARVGRYRVGFRREDGSVIAHVDKRGQASAGMMTEGKN